MLITCPKCSAKYKIPAEIRLTEGKKMQCSACQHVFEFHMEEEVKVEEKPSLVAPEDAVLSINTKTERIVVKTQEPQQTPPQPSVLPEVFRPVQLQREHSSIPYFWILLCFILLTGFMAMAWMYRDLLTNRAFFMPTVPTIQKIERVAPVVKVEPSKKAPLLPVHPEPLPTPDPLPEPQVEFLPKLPSEELPLETIGPSAQVEQPSVPEQNLSVQSVRFRKTPAGQAVLIEGVLKNTTSQPLSVPEKVYALAYNTEGVLIFEKEIYLPSGILYPNMEQPFFGTYTPVTEEIQWVDVVLKK